MTSNASGPADARSRAWLDVWMKALEDAERAGFVEVAGPAELGAVQGDLYHSSRECLALSADATRLEGVEHAGLAATDRWPDLVRRRYAVPELDLDLELVDSAMYLLVRISSGRLSLADGAVALTRTGFVVASRPGARWQLDFPARLAEDVWYSSNPGEDLVGMAATTDRLDARLHAGRLELLFVKKHPQYLGFGPPTPWFDDATRARLAAARP